MEATDGSTGDGDEEAWEDRTLLDERFRTQPRRILVEIAGSQIAPQLRQGWPLDEQSDHQRTCHEKQREGKERIYLSDNLVDRQKRSDDVVDEDEDNPEHLTSHKRARIADAIQNNGRTIYKHGTHHHQQQYREHEHHLLGVAAQILAHQLRQSGTIMADTEHTTHIIVHGTGKDAAKHNPKISHRSIPGTHDGSKYRSSTGNIQELDHKDFPTRQHHKVNSVGFCHCWRRTVVRTENMRHKFSIKEVAQYQGCQTNDETDHFLLLFFRILSSF